MSIQRTIVLLTGLSWLTFANPLSASVVRNSDTILADQPGASLQQQVREVASFLEGMMDTSAQAASNPKAPSVRMTTCEITVTGSSSSETSQSIFLYQEQALTKDLTKPYRQRFLQLSPSVLSQSVRSQSFKPTNPQQWSGFCNKPASDRVVQLADLGSPVCNVYLRRSNLGYVGNTPTDGCPANVRGAVRITNHIVLTAAGMDTWDRGFDAIGKQVWGAKAESYQYRRITAKPQ